MPGNRSSRHAPPSERVESEAPRTRQTARSVHRSAAALAWTVTCSFLTSLAWVGTASAQTKPPVPEQRVNPFFTPSGLPFGAPPFDRIRSSDFVPALDEGMRRQTVAVQSIVDQRAPPTFDNTLVPLERSGQLLDRVLNVFAAMTAVAIDSTLAAAMVVEIPKLIAHRDTMYLDAALFRRIGSLHGRVRSLELSPEQRRLVERYYQAFVRNGALLSPEQKEELRCLNQLEATRSAEFQRRLLAATDAGAVTISDSTRLDGLRESEIRNAAREAASRGLRSRWVLALQGTTEQAAEERLTDRSLRKELHEASVARAEHGDPHDTRSVVLLLADERARKARLLGFASYASYALADAMAGTPEAVGDLLRRVLGPALTKTRAITARIRATLDREGGSVPLEPWDWPYHTARLRQAAYDVTEARVRPYFELNQVLRDGVFYAARRLYGVTFEERHDVPVYAPGVRVFEVLDTDRSPLGLLYCDYFERKNKGGGAWMGSFVEQSRLMGTKSVVYNVANFPVPSAHEPVLLDVEEVITVFHEFGHTLGAMLSDVTYPSLSESHVPRDFMELPSQLNEELALDPEVLAHYARHYRTHTPMPSSLAHQVRDAHTFDESLAMTGYLASAVLDLAWHSIGSVDEIQDVDRFEEEVLRRWGLDLPHVPPRYRSSYFAHVWEWGYGSCYYSYLWSEMLDDNVYVWLQRHGGLTRANGQRFRDLILSKGDTEDATTLIRVFLGRSPLIQPLLAARGLDVGG